MARILSSQFDRNASANQPVVPVMAAGARALGALSSDAPAIAAPGADQSAVTLDDRLAAESEIARLTWQVLDGQASLEVRQRLAELVSNQYRARQLPR